MSISRYISELQLYVKHLHQSIGLHKAYANISHTSGIREIVKEMNPVCFFLFCNTVMRS